MGRTDQPQSCTQHTVNRHSNMKRQDRSLDEILPLTVLQHKLIGREDFCKRSSVTGQWKLTHPTHSHLHTKSRFLTSHGKPDRLAASGSTTGRGSNASSHGECFPQRPERINLAIEGKKTTKRNKPETEKSSPYTQADSKHGARNYSPQMCFHQTLPISAVE